jgi:hypothetical protein
MFSTFVMFEKFNKKSVVCLALKEGPALLPPGFNLGRPWRRAYGLAILVFSSATDGSGRRHRRGENLLPRGAYAAYDHRYEKVLRGKRPPGTSSRIGFAN